MRPIVRRAARLIPVDFCPVGEPPRVSVMLSRWHRDVIAAGGPGTMSWLSFSAIAIAIGIGTSLVLDEFALILLRISATIPVIDAGLALVRILKGKYRT